MVARIISELPGGNGSLTDQLRRAALSVPVNVAEGVGRSSVADRRRQYAIARGSAMECASILDACRVLQLTNSELLADGRSLVLRVVQMLSKVRVNSLVVHVHDYVHGYVQNAPVRVRTSL